jgi:hypothetical protein
MENGLRISYFSKNQTLAYKFFHEFFHLFKAQNGGDIDMDHTAARLFLVKARDTTEVVGLIGQH